MFNCVNIPVRNQYFICTNELKKNNTALNENDFLNIGYMAGRFGVNLTNPNEPNHIIKDGNGLYLNINSCCSPLFESNLEQAGINFNKLV